MGNYKLFVVSKQKYDYDFKLLTIAQALYYGRDFSVVHNSDILVQNMKNETVCVIRRAEIDSVPDINWDLVRQSEFEK